MVHLLRGDRINFFDFTYHSWKNVKNRHSQAILRGIKMITTLLEAKEIEFPTPLQEVEVLIFSINTISQGTSH